MDNLPNNKIKPTDNIADVKAKQNSQEVRAHVIYTRDDYCSNALPVQVTALIMFCFFYRE